MSAQERWDSLVLGEFVRTQPRGLRGSFLSRFKWRHRAVGSNALPAAILRANDGLCSNLSLVMGVAGASISHHDTLIIGIAGLLAGACSMALGEWFSVTRLRELAERGIRIESGQLTKNPQDEERHLIYEAKGLPSGEAKRLVGQILQDKEPTLEALSREDLGIDPTELGGVANEAAFAAFVLFSVGAIIPILPFLLPGLQSAIVTSLLVSSTALFAIGAGFAIFTGVSVWRSGGRQLLLGVSAAVLTFGIGRLVEAALA
jgi:vacuolar iron transporter family protein